jgi:hypothetical protein
MYVCAFGLACAAAGINSESAQSVIFHAALFLYCCKFAIERDAAPAAAAKRNLMEKMLSVREAINYNYGETRARGERREWMRGERAISACPRASERCPLIAKVLGEKEEIG